MKIKLLTLPLTLVATVAIPTVTISSCGNKTDPVTPDVKVNKVTVTSTTSSIEVGSSITLTAKVEPTDAKNKSVTWSVDSNIATIDSNGTLTANAAGTVKVTATAKDGSGISGFTNITITEPTYSSETWEDYVFNRTFTVKGHSDSMLQTICGTCWVLSDATPTILDDYQYYVVTNWHVTKHQQQYSDIKMSFACNKERGMSPNDWIDFPTGGYENVDDKYSTYENYKEQMDLGKVTGYKGCDIHVAKANFSPITTSSSASAAIAKAKLDKLNELTAKGQPITKLAASTTDAIHHESVKMYTAGYPDNTSIKWEQHDLTSENVPLFYVSKETQDWSHSLEDYKPCIIDCTPQYISNITLPTTWMTHGASGSMLFGDFGSGTKHNWKVCGIYWGGWEVVEPAGQFYASFSIFNSEWYNFLSEWAK